VPRIVPKAYHRLPLNEANLVMTADDPADRATEATDRAAKSATNSA
jgi:hypothetical protein